MSSHLSFTGWSDHYIQDVYIAVDHWRLRNPDLTNSAVFVQMEEIRNAARLEWDTRRHAEESRRLAAFMARKGSV